MAIDTAADLAAIIADGDVPLLSVAYAQGSVTKAAVVAFRLLPVNRSGGEGLDNPLTQFAIQSSEFAAGFSGPASITPSPNDELTLAGEAAWQVDVAEQQGGGSFWLLTVSKRIQRGSA